LRARVGTWYSRAAVGKNSAWPACTQTDARIVDPCKKWQREKNSKNI